MDIRRRRRSEAKKLVHHDQFSSREPPSNIVIDREQRDALTARTSFLSEDGSVLSSASWEPMQPAIQTKTPSAIPEVGTAATTEDSSDSGSAATSKKQQWKEAYEPAPMAGQDTILYWGFFLFVLSIIWPPLILLFAYIASKIIPYSYRTSDCPANRRKIFTEFSKQEDLPANYKEMPEGIELEDSYWANDRGMLLHTITMLPTKTPIRAVVFYCHGYCDNVSFEKILAKQRMVHEGIAFVAIEYEGHGLSDGPLGLISDFDVLVGDVTDYAVHVSERFPGLPLFLMGESMGGAVAYSVQSKIPDLIKGVVFVCPMCKISDNMLPPQWVIDVLIWAIGKNGDDNTSWLGYLPIAPAREQMVTHKDPEKLLLASRVPLCFGRNPRLATARELITVTQRISASMSEFDAPFLVVHGQADTVTDPKLSQALYDESKSKDKSIRLYPEMYHALMCGEPDDNADVVFRDCINWILERVDED